MPKKISIEDSLKRLSEISNEMEKPDLSLEQSLKLYEESTKLISGSYKILEQAELKVRELELTIENIEESL